MTVIEMQRLINRANRRTFVVAAAAAVAIYMFYHENRKLSLENYNLKYGDMK